MQDAHPGGAGRQEPPEFAIRARGLSKTYRGRSGEAPKAALNAIDLEIPRGAVFGLLGPNGAGKSTFINILAGLVIKSGGTAEVWGRDIDREPRAARAAIGVVPQELNIDPFFTPRELLEVQAGLFGVPRAERRTDEILAALALSDKADAYARSLSGGMRRRLLVAKAMVHVELRQQLWTYVRSLSDQGTTVLLTTHYLEEAQQLCDRIAIIDRGELVAHDSTEALLRRLDRKELAITVAEELAAVPAQMADFSVELLPPRRLIVRYKPSAVRIGDILAAVRTAGLTIADLSTEESDLEDIFLELTGRGAREGAAAAASHSAAMATGTK
jgi:ABC-2 type transport system ATP-binding protein